MIDVCQVVPNDFSRFVHPRFGTDLSISTPGGDDVNLINNRIGPSRSGYAISAADQRRGGKNREPARNRAGAHLFAEKDAAPRHTECRDEKDYGGRASPDIA